MQSVPGRTTIPAGTNITIFILFFGIALIEAIHKHNWLEGALFLGLGLMALWADIKDKRPSLR